MVNICHLFIGNGVRSLESVGRSNDARDNCAEAHWIAVYDALDG
jgi:hypothetical protein